MNDSPLFRPLPGVFEPSAVQQLADGRFLVVEDEKAYPLSVFRIDPDGAVETTALPVDGWELDDLEGLAADSAGRLYAITSHSRDGDGDEQAERNQLLRFRIDDNALQDVRQTSRFKTALVATHPVFTDAVAEKDVKGRGGLNVEALEINPRSGALMVGLRSPVMDGRAVIITIENPDAVFDQAQAMRIAPELITLDLGGDGLRGMAFLTDLNGYLLISGPTAKLKVPFRLWFWRGDASHTPKRVQARETACFEHAEGICPAVIDGQAKIVLVSDDGSRKSGRFAQFAILDPQILLMLD